MNEHEVMRVKLDYPLERVKEPIIYHLVTDYRLVPNIRRANIDHNAGGMMILEIEGDPDDLEAGIELSAPPGNHRHAGWSGTIVDDLKSGVQVFGIQVFGVRCSGMEAFSLSSSRAVPGGLL